MNKKRLAAAIAKRRKELGLTNEEAGKKAGFDSPSVAKQTLYRAQNKPEEVSAGSMLAIARSMGVPKEIFDLVTEVQPSHTFYEVRNPDQLAAFANGNSINDIKVGLSHIKKSDAIESIKFMKRLDLIELSEKYGRYNFGKSTKLEVEKILDIHKHLLILRENDLRLYVNWYDVSMAHWREPGSRLSDNNLYEMPSLSILGKISGGELGEVQAKKISKNEWGFYIGYLVIANDDDPNVSRRNNGYELVISNIEESLKSNHLKIEEYGSKTTVFKKYMTGTNWEDWGGMNPEEIEDEHALQYTYYDPSEQQSEEEEAMHQHYEAWERYLDQFKFFRLMCLNGTWEFEPKKYFYTENEKYLPWDFPEIKKLIDDLEKELEDKKKMEV